MRNRLEVTFEGDHVRVISDGEKDFEFSVRLWTAVADLCNEHNCFKVLGIANTTSPLEAIEGYDQARLFRQLGIDKRFKIAWVEADEDARDMAHFVKSVMRSRGLFGRVFDDVHAAEQWLFADTKRPDES